MNRIYLSVIDTIFEGEFRDGTFHGYGGVYWSHGQKMDGIWFQNECRDKQYIFNDGLTFCDNDWKYCQFPDRRYQTCLKHGLKPAGATLRTNNPNEFVIPPMCHDAGIGIFNPRTHTITCYQNSMKILEIPTTNLTNWIRKNCQKAWSEPTGNRKDLYENWFSYKFDMEILSTLLPFSNHSFESWWKRK
ncbi:PREDICTED: MORN repeat-containing protein 5 isoform X2 [Eufriesea mexicana]|uniref:MORN repeat-containing protein 5 isoform X2 n=1 Tax=Eufriesea mexicana TaxID=516756 RepID=UPI00083BF1B1|nr:PREDICTED: MORN repeat-containing protein 5 isoform X2 [Eufriesea mexicana]